MHRKLGFTSCARLLSQLCNEPCFEGGGGGGGGFKFFGEFFFFGVLDFCMFWGVGGWGGGWWGGVLKFSVEFFFCGSSDFVLYEGLGAAGLPLSMTTFTPDITAAWYNIKLMDTENCTHIAASTTALLLLHFTARQSSVSNKTQHDFLQETFTAQNYFIQFVYMLHILSIQGKVPVLRHL